MKSDPVQAAIQRAAACYPAEYWAVLPSSYRTAAIYAELRQIDAAAVQEADPTRVPQRVAEVQNVTGRFRKTISGAKPRARGCSIGTTMQRRPEQSVIPRRSGMDRSVSDRGSARGFAPLTKEPTNSLKNIGDM
jgi:hypothetical protein